MKGDEKTIIKTPTNKCLFFNCTLNILISHDHPFVFMLIKLAIYLCRKYKQAQKTLCKNEKQ